jgi:hypothetical protein
MQEELWVFIVANADESGWEPSVHLLFAISVVFVAILEPGVDEIEEVLCFRFQEVRETHLNQAKW